MICVESFPLRAQKIQYKHILVITDTYTKGGQEFNTQFRKKAYRYSAGQKKCYKYCFMKQKCQLQMGMAQYRNIATPFSTRGINTTHQFFQMNYIILPYLKGLKNYQLEFKCILCFTTETAHLKFDGC